MVDATANNTAEALGALLQAQRERIPEAFAHASNQVLKQKAHDGRVERLLAVAHQTRKALPRMQWLHRAATVWAEPVAPLSACKRGCTHCCHMPVAVFEDEARLIAQASGRPVCEPKDFTRLSIVGPPEEEGERELRSLAAYTGQRCPFLSGGDCSIYEQRPLACRTHFNLDRDELLCRLSAPEIQVPQADATVLLATCFAILGVTRVADIREWFPLEPKLEE